jgi:hypothetical protein
LEELRGALKISCFRHSRTFHGRGSHGLVPAGHSWPSTRPFFFTLPIFNNRSKRALAARLARRQPTCHQPLLAAGARESHSPSPGGVCAASSTRSRNSKDRVDAVEAGRTPLLSVVIRYAAQNQWVNGILVR